MSEETKTESSEEVKDQVSAEEALKAAEQEASPAGESEQQTEPQTVPLEKHVKLRVRAQVAEIAQAKAEGALEAIQQMQVKEKPAAVSPLDTEIAKQRADGIPDDEMQIPASVMKADKLYERQVANQLVTDAADKQLRSQQKVSITKSKGIHDDWQTVISAGQDLLTEGQVGDIGRAGENFGELTYELCQTAITKAKPESNKAAPSESEAEKAEREAKEEAEKEKGKVPTRAEILKSIDADPAIVGAALL